jgi:DNA polymerase I-like protein with 3'-5' exonuclease and polymerase domains
MFGKSEAGVTDSERTVAKMINFGIAYGITPVGLFTRLKPQGVDMTLEQFEQFIDDYFNAYSGVQKFINDVETRLKERALTERQDNAIDPKLRAFLVAVHAGFSGKPRRTLTISSIESC